MTPAWTLRAWPPVYRAAGDAVAFAFEHRDTQLFDDDAGPRLAGQTMWVWPDADGDVGVAWDWIQLQRGVVAMLDPMSVLTNLKLLGSGGEVLTAWQAARHVNQIVYTLPWQHEVRRVLARREPAATDRAGVPSRHPLPRVEVRQRPALRPGP
jgi:hypothetical protein